MSDWQQAEVQAAGGVIWRQPDDDEGKEVEVLLVHRPRYDDWSLAKGKLDDGESWEQAAIREVEEEVGLTLELGEELTPVTYEDGKGRPKAVRYWLMQAPADTPEFVPNEEVDAVRWVRGGDAVSELTYQRDAELLAEALERLGDYSAHGGGL